MGPVLHDYTVFDLETTGKKIIQIGALKVRADQTVAKFSTYVNPLEKIQDQVTWLTGISNLQTNAAPKIDEVMPDFLDFIGSDTLVGHNILKFDCNILAHNGYPVANPKLDTLILAKQCHFLDPIPNVKLSTLKDYYGIKINSHIAISDCITNNIVYQNLRDGKLARATETIDFSPKPVDSRLAGQRFVITGQFPQATRYELVSLINSHGGRVTGSVSGLTDYLLKGQLDHVSGKCRMAEAKGTTIIDYQGLLDLLK